MIGRLLQPVKKSPQVAKPVHKPLNGIDARPRPGCMAGIARATDAQVQNALFIDGNFINGSAVRDHSTAAAQTSALKKIPDARAAAELRGRAPTARRK